VLLKTVIPRNTIPRGKLTSQSTSINYT